MLSGDHLQDSNLGSEEECETDLEKDLETDLEKEVFEPLVSWIRKGPL